MKSYLPIFDLIASSISELQVDEIKERLRPLLSGYRVQVPIFEPGVFLYRGRILTGSFRKNTITRADLVYPPAASTRAGRANRAGSPVFYSSTGRESVFFELPNLTPGDELILSFWKSTERMVLNNIGYTTPTFERMGAGRSLPQWWPEGSQTSDPRDGHIIDEDYVAWLKEEFSKAFCHPANSRDQHLYKLSTAIAEIHVGTISSMSGVPIPAEQFAGVMYPSVQMRANGDNVALQPWFVDQHLELRKATHIRVTSRDDMRFVIDRLDDAVTFDESGRLAWLGRLKNWTMTGGHSARADVVEGVDEDGDYSVSDEGQRLHWTITDTSTGFIIPSA